MSIIRTLFATTAIALTASLPLSAADLSSETGMGDARPAGSGSNIGAGNTTAGVSGSTGTDLTGTMTKDSAAYVDAMVYASAFMDDDVQTKDGKFVGKISKVDVDQSGDYLLTIDLDDGTYGPNTEVDLLVDSTTKADGKLNLGWTEAEFMARAKI